MQRGSRIRVVVTAVAATLVAGGCSGKHPVADECVSCDGPPPWRDPPGAIATAYEELRYELFEPILHPDFQFVLYWDFPNPSGPSDWGRTEELRIHRRLFDPRNIPPSEGPLPSEQRPNSIAITLSAASRFEELELPVGWDPTRWRLAGALFDAALLVETQTGTHAFGGDQYFVVAQDLSKVPGDPGWLLLYRWQDLGPGSAEERSWTAFKCGFVEAASP